MDKVTIREAAERVGGIVALAKALALTKGAVSQWERVPAEHVLAVEGLTGFSRHVLRPDVFGPQPGSTPRLTSVSGALQSVEQARVP